MSIPALNLKNAPFKNVQLSNRNAFAITIHVKPLGLDGLQVILRGSTITGTQGDYIINGQYKATAHSRKFDGGNSS